MEGSGIMGRTPKIRSPEEMEESWENYKKECNNQKVLTHDFSSKNSEFVSAELRRSITYTVEGFCIYMKISRQQYYGKYSKTKRYIDIVTRIREECEVDARKKFELQIIPSQLAGLWMSKYGYSNKTETDIEEQRARIEQIKAGTARMTGGDDTELAKLDDVLSEIKGVV